MSDRPYGGVVCKVWHARSSYTNKGYLEE